MWQSWFTTTGTVSTNLTILKPFLLLENKAERHKIARKEASGRDRKRQRKAAGGDEEMAFN
jgi:hypothetical protein